MIRENDIAPSMVEILRHRDAWRAGQEKTTASANERTEAQTVSGNDLGASLHGVDEMAEQLSGLYF